MLTHTHDLGNNTNHGAGRESRRFIHLKCINVVLGARRSCGFASHLFNLQEKKLENRDRE